MLFNSDDTFQNVVDFASETGNCTGSLGKIIEVSTDLYNSMPNTQAVQFGNRRTIRRHISRA